MIHLPGPPLVLPLDLNRRRPDDVRTVRTYATHNGLNPQASVREIRSTTRAIYLVTHMINPPGLRLARFGAECQYSSLASLQEPRVTICRSPG